jgi:signal transduction histidine kinase
LARNLHDGPTQAIASIAMRLNFVKLMLKREGDINKAQDELDIIEKIANRTTQEIRTMLFTLRPVVLETQGLNAALYQYAERLRDLDGLNIELDVDNYDGRLSTEEEGVIFTIIEEAVGNAKKHSKTETLNIRVGVLKESIVAEVADNGAGFDVEAIKSSYDQRGSLGLLNMDERAKMIGGHCRIISAVGKGTTVRLEVPLAKNGAIQ